MKVKINCDDGFETHLEIPEDILSGDIIDEVRNVRKTHGYDVYDNLNTLANHSHHHQHYHHDYHHPTHLSSSSTTSKFSIAYQLHHTNNHNSNNNKNNNTNKKNSTGNSSSASVPTSALEYSDLQNVSLKLPIKTILGNLPTTLTNTTNKNNNDNTYELIFYIYGFKSQQQSQILQQLYQFSSKFSLLNMAFSSAMEKYATSYHHSNLNQDGYHPSIIGSNSVPPADHIPTFGNSLKIGESSSSSYLNPPQYNAVEVVSNRLIQVYSELQTLFDEVLAKPNLDIPSRSILLKAKNSLLAGDLANTISILQFPAFDSVKGNNSSHGKSNEVALIPVNHYSLGRPTQNSSSGPSQAVTIPMVSQGANKQPEPSSSAASKKGAKSTKATSAPSGKSSEIPSATIPTAAPIVAANSSGSVPMDVVPATLNKPITLNKSLENHQSKNSSSLKDPPPSSEESNKQSVEKNNVKKTQNDAPANEKSRTTSDSSKVVIEGSNNKVDSSKPTAAKVDKASDTVKTAVSLPSSKKEDPPAKLSSSNEKAKPVESSESDSDTESSSGSSTTSNGTQVTSSSSGSSSSSTTANTLVSDSRKKPPKSDAATTKPNHVTTLETQPFLPEAIANKAKGNSKASDAIDEIFGQASGVPSAEVSKVSASTATSKIKKADSATVPVESSSNNKNSNISATLSIPVTSPSKKKEPVDLAALKKSEPIPPITTSTKATSKSEEVKTPIVTKGKGADIADHDSDSESSSSGSSSGSGSSSSGSGSGSDDDSDSDSESSVSQKANEESKNKKNEFALTSQTSVKKILPDPTTARTTDTPHALRNLLSAAPPVLGRPSLPQSVLPSSAVKAPSMKADSDSDSDSKSSSTASSDNGKRDMEDDIGALPVSKGKQATGKGRQLRSNSKSEDSKPKVLPVHTVKSNSSVIHAATAVAEPAANNPAPAPGKKNPPPNKTSKEAPSLRNLVESASTVPTTGKDGEDELVVFVQPPPKEAPKKRASKKRDADTAGLTEAPESQVTEAPVKKPETKNNTVPKKSTAPKTTPATTGNKRAKKTN